jgi:hypothetical protein
VAWDGLQQVSTDAQGHLLLQTPGGTVVQEAPVLYQMIDGVRHDVSGQAVMLANGDMGFQAGS